MTHHPAAVKCEVHDAPIESAHDQPTAEYLDFLRRVVEQARVSMREGRGRSNEEVKAAFAEKHARTLAGL